MFGYIKVNQANLSTEEREIYKGIYCSLCKRLGKDYSVFARFILSFDCTFYAMLALDLAEQAPCCHEGRCRFNPLKKCNYIQSETKALSLAAALSVILAYYKLLDNLHDSPWYQKILYRILQPFFARWRKKAMSRYPKIDVSAKKMMEAQWKAEENPDCVLDMAAEPTAVMLSEVCALLPEHIDLRNGLEKSRTERILKAMGYFVGRWIYLIDAADDYEKDSKHHNFNPFILSSINADDLPSHMKATLNHALSEALLSYGLLDKGRYDSIIQNVLCISCVNIQNKIINNR